MDPSQDDEQLVQQARSAPEGDLRAFEALVERHQRRVTTNCRYLTGSAEDAEDLAQEVLVKAFFGLSSFEGRSKFSTWVGRIKMNHCLNYLKGKDRRPHLSVDEPGLDGSAELHVSARAERAVHARDQRERIREVLQSLPDTLRIPLILRDLDRISYHEIAESLGVGLSAVKMRIKRGREEFRKRYTESAAVEETAL